MVKLMRLAIALLLVQHVATELVAFKLANYRLQNYAFDMANLKFGKVEDGAMRFTKAGVRAKRPEPLLEAAE